MSSEKVDLNDYMTRQEVQEVLGCSPRAFWRMIDRAGRDKYSITVLGRTLVPKSAIDTLREYYYPMGSDARAKVAREYGAMGGNKKAANARAAKRKATK